MDEKNKLRREDLKEISGGTAEQMAELRAFIRSHDPGYQINDDFDVVYWLAERSGLGLDNSMIGDADDNLYVLNGERIDHATVMSMLYARFPG